MNSPIKTMVKKSNEKVRDLSHSVSRSESEGKTPKVYQKVPMNDQFKGVAHEDVRVAAPEDGSVPVWKSGTGKVFPMVKSRNEDGSFEYRPRKKKGPARGSKFRPRAAKIAKMMQMGDLTGGLGLDMGAVAAIDESILSPASISTQASSEASLSPFGGAISGPELEALRKSDAVDYQALVHSWQMRSIGALTDQEFQMIKNSIFQARAERKLAAQQMSMNLAADMPRQLVPELGPLEPAEMEQSDMTF